MAKKITTNLTSICCVRRKLLKTTHAKEQIQKVATLNSDCKIINLIPNKSFRYYKQ